MRVWAAHQRVNGHSLGWRLFSEASPLSWSYDLSTDSVHWSRKAANDPQQQQLSAARFCINFASLQHTENPPSGSTGADSSRARSYAR